MYFVYAHKMNINTHPPETCNTCCCCLALIMAYTHSAHETSEWERETEVNNTEIVLVQFVHEHFIGISINAEYKMNCTSKTSVKSTLKYCSTFVFRILCSSPSLSPRGSLSPSSLSSHAIHTIQSILQGCERHSYQ